MFKGGEYVDGEKKGLVRVSFAFGVAKGTKSPLWDGVMVLDAPHFWCVSTCELKIADPPGALKVRNEYDIDKDGVPIATGYVSFNSGVFNTETVREDKMVRHSGIPEHEFTLAAFGLPEPMGMPQVDRGGIRWYIWLALAALGPLALAALWLTLKRRYFSSEPVKK